MLLLAAVREELGDLDGEVLGIGAVVAAARAAALLALHRPDAVLMIGTGAAYRNGPAIGSAVTASRVGLASGAAAMGLGYVPRPPAAVLAHESLLSQIDLPRVDVLTVAAVTTDPTLAERLADGWSVEHVEAYGVALACHLAGVPFAGIFGIASRAGLDAHAQWLTHRDAAQEAARSAAHAFLARRREP
jgi:nucleoside phosphorylase